MSKEGRSENLREMGNNRDIYFMQIEGWSILKENINPTPLVPKSL